MGYVEDFFEKIDLATINRFVAEKMSEDLHIEFKAPRNRDEAKRPLAKAVSAFANADGGVIIWGVERKGNLCEPRPIANAAAFREQLEDLTGQAVSPPALGVSSVLILEEAEGGYIKTLVPASDLTPHMAMFGDNRYYRRSGGNSRAMEHYELEDMFGRRPKPKLSLLHELEQGEGGGGHTNIKVVLALSNSGRGVARSVSLWVQKQGGEKYRSEWGVYSPPGTVSFRRAPAWPTGGQGGDCFFSDAGLVIQPDMRCAVAAMNIRVSEKDNTVPDLVVSYHISAEGVLGVRGTYTVPGQSLLAKARPYFRSST